MKWRNKTFVQSLIIFAIASASVAIAIPVRPTQSSEPKPGGAPSQGGMTDEMENMLHGAQNLREQDPLKALSNDMGQISDDLGQQQTGAPVQGEQKQVVSQLDKLIDELSRQTNGNGGSSNNPTKPMADSKIAKGPGDMGPMHDPQAGVKSWGQLPAKDRDKILQSQNDGFPAGYESLLSSYYNRLAQEQVGDENKTLRRQRSRDRRIV